MQKEKAGQRQARGRSATRKRRQARLRIAWIAFALLVFGAFAYMLLTAPGRTDGDLSGPSVSALVTTPAINTQDDTEISSTTASLTPTSSPSPAPTPTPTPEPTPTPTPEPAAWSMPEPVEILVSAAGDCTLGGESIQGTAVKFANCYKKEGPEYFFRNVRQIFSADDVTIVNLEGPLTTSTNMRAGRKFNFKGDPGYIQILSNSGIEVCNVANNHTLDYGREGLQETAKVLQDAGIGLCGYTSVCYQEIRGVKIGFVGFECWEHTQAEAVGFVKEIRPTCDVLIASFHWGQEYSFAADSFQKKCGRALIDAGADLVVGHHSHVVGGIEQYKGKYILYSLGNFCFGGNTNPKDKDCMIFQQRLIVEANGTVRDGGIRIIPCSVSSTNATNNYQPTPLKGKEYTRVLKKIRAYSSVKDLILLDGEE